MRRAAGLGAFWVGAVRLIGGRKWLAGGGEWCRYLRRSAEAPKRRSAEAPKRRNAEAPKHRSTEAPKHRSAEPSMLRTPPLRAPARVSPIPGALQYRADRPRAGHLGAFLPPARRDRVPRALLIR
ncbi:hypothetical protein GTC054_01160 [Burkholderia pseudomallei]|nr:hypothetical protein GTC054_01160 [Burkholderia pseudomallei]